MTTLRTPAKLADAGLVDADRIDALAAVARRYAIAVPPAMAALIDRADAADPIARQLIPTEAELDAAPGESPDPIGDDRFSPVAGIVHRYPDRVLLKATHTCAVYCRFCFRREMVGPGAAKALTPAELDAAFAYIAANPAIWEVILTGGDPLVLSARRIGEIVRRLAAIDHVKIVRFHTRVPVADPALVTDELVAAMRHPRLTSYVALHANHPRELTPAARAACARIVGAGLPMVSQSVLLAGVNDDADTLAALMRAFIEAGVKPYYLHHLDPAPGTSHFRVSLERGQTLMRALRGRVSGLAQPTYVLDIPGGHGKVPLTPEYVGDGCVTDPWGETHAYAPSEPARGPRGESSTP